MREADTGDRKFAALAQGDYSFPIGGPKTRGKQQGAGLEHEVHLVRVSGQVHQLGIHSHQTGVVLAVQQLSSGHDARLWERSSACPADSGVLKGWGISPTHRKAEDFHPVSHRQGIWLAADDLHPTGLVLAVAGQKKPRAG